MWHACGRQFQEEVEERAQKGLQEAGAQEPSQSGAPSGGGSPMTFRAGNSFMAGTEPAAASSLTGRPTINGNGRQAVIATPPDLQACMLAFASAHTRADSQLCLVMVLHACHGDALDARMPRAMLMWTGCRRQWTSCALRWRPRALL